MKIKVIVVLISCLFLQGCALVGLAQMSNRSLLPTPQWKQASRQICKECRSGLVEQGEKQNNEYVDYYQYTCKNCGNTWYD